MLIIFVSTQKEKKNNNNRNKNMNSSMLIFTNDDLGVNEKNYFLPNNKKVYLKNKDITLQEMKEYYLQFIKEKGLSFDGGGEEMKRKGGEDMEGVEGEERRQKKELLYFIDDRATTLMTSEKLSEIEEHLQLLLNDVDIFYLSNFMDNCKVMKPISSHLPDNLNNIRFYHSMAPNGFYATVTTFEKWEKIFGLLEDRKEQKISSKLSSLVLEGKLKAGTTWPRIFVPDINKLSNDMDNFYTYPCRIEKNFVNSEKKEIEELSMFWFVLGVSLILVCFMVMTKVFSVRKLWNGMEDHK